MAGGAVAPVGGNAHIALLVDPNRTWYNNRRYVWTTRWLSALTCWLFQPYLPSLLDPASVSWHGVSIGDNPDLEPARNSLITSSTNGFDNSLMNSFQSMPQWENYFGKPMGGKLGILNAIQVC